MPALGLALGLPYGRNAAASFAGPLDTYATGLWDAWGFARLLSSYSGNLTQVRETGGSTALDIGAAANGLLNSAALASHVGSNSGFVAKLHGQANGRHMLMATTGAQPRIVNAGTNVTLSGNIAMEAPASNTQRMVTNGVTAYTGTALTMLAVCQANGTAIMGRGALNILDASQRSDVVDTLACFSGNGLNGTNLIKGDTLSAYIGDSVPNKIRVQVGVFDGTNKKLYDSYELPGTSVSSAETTAFNMDRVGVWSYTAGASWSVAGEKWLAGAVWTRALTNTEILGLITALKTFFSITVP